MDRDRDAGLTADDLAVMRTELEWKRKDCDIAFDRDIGAWAATIWYSETGFRYVVGPSLTELQEKLVLKLGTNEGREAG